MEEVGQLLGMADDAHAAAAAAGLGLEDDGIADLFGGFEGIFEGGQDAVGAGQDGHLGPLHGLARLFLFAHEASDFGGRSDELDVGGATDFSEVCVFAQKAIAGMNGVDVGDFGGGDDGRHVEIAVGGPGRTDADGLVGKADVERVAVGLGVDGDRADAEFPAGVDDAECDFATIGDENFTKHGPRDGSRLAGRGNAASRLASARSAYVPFQNSTSARCC